ncbi:MAG: ATP synthase F1 subunit delta [Deltaproteobacteria bacterium]|nr:ATP synthase F1 subunit delta [Deltaproteobacteria bacterium]
MSAGLIAKRYARATMNLAGREKSSETVIAALDSLVGAMKEVPRLSAAIADPKISQSVKRGVMEDLTRTIKAPALVVNLVRLLTEKRRLVLLPEICASCHALDDARAGRAEAQVRSATPLSAKQQEELRGRLEKLSGKKLTLQVETDSSLLGGLVARIGSTVWDGSLRNQLNQIRQSFIEG